MRTPVDFLRRKAERRLCSESVKTMEEKQAMLAFWVKRDAWRSRHCSEKEMGFWTEDLKRAE